jgi:hypothetical protein
LLFEHLDSIYTLALMDRLTRVYIFLMQTAKLHSLGHLLKLQFKNVMRGKGIGADCDAAEIVDGPELLFPGGCCWNRSGQRAPL